MPKSPTYHVASNPVLLDPGYEPELAVLFAGESQTRPSHRVGPKIVDYYLFHDVISGRGTFVTEDKSAELRGGHSFLIRPGQLVSYVSDEQEPWHYRWVAFSGKNAANLVAEAGLGPDVPIVDSRGDKKAGERCKKIYEAFRSRRSSASLEAAGHLHLMLAGLQAASEGLRPARLRPDSHAEELVRQIAGYLSTQYAEPVTIEAMAEALGYNRAYLSRIFRRSTGLTPIAFLTRTRVDHGRRLLRERPELTIEQIASSVGFADALYFSKQFRRQYGQSPSDYRTQVR
ncbi:AraC family transcriptional regulator [Cohnella algarum]|uniref:AraC family transcriptional regulator n=1 Tax=Cohnella algarum TaxID=2044859 RepID=UPI0019671828|nr:AraC family transcriptional regulator [Cohnella algarum]MBN2982603.1 AraC family transcriptional regulator [Cohnella algarum]